MGIRINPDKLAAEINQIYKPGVGHIVTPENCEMILKKIQSLQAHPNTLCCLYNSTHGVFSTEMMFNPEGQKIGDSHEYSYLKQLALLGLDAIDQMKINAIVQKLLSFDGKGYVIAQIDKGQDYRL